MQISAIQKTSLIDYPNKISSIIFTQGCNLRCGFCYNVQLVQPIAEADLNNYISEAKILTFLNSRKNILDAIVITGGEPTLQSGLKNFISKIKKIGFLVKLDTNGLRPQILNQLLRQKLVDYVAMDIKVPLEKYSQLVPKISSKLKTYNSKPQFKTQNLPPNYKKNIKNSIKIILNQSPNYEFRSTLIKGWHDENHVIKMAQMINGAKKYFLQKFEPKKNLLNPEFKKYKPFSMEEMKEFASIAKKYVRDCEIRGY